MTSRVQWLVLLFPLAVLGAAGDLAAGSLTGRAAQSRRRAVGRINGGGTLIELATTNDAIHVRAAGADQTPGPRTPERL